MDRRLRWPYWLLFTCACGIAAWLAQFVATREAATAAERRLTVELRSVSEPAAPPVALAGGTKVTPSVRLPAAAPESIEDLARDCYRQDLDACLRLGQAHIAERNLAAAREALEGPCASGNERACLAIREIDERRPDLAPTGVLTADGKEEYRKLAEERCNGGSAVGCYHLGSVLRLDGDRAQAAHAFQRGCEGGIRAACANWGVLLKQSGDLETARHVFEQSCRALYVPSCERLASLEKSLGNDKAAEEAAELACRLGETALCKPTKNR